MFLCSIARNKKQAVWLHTGHRGCWDLVVCATVHVSVGFRASTRVLCRLDLCCAISAMISFPDIRQYTWPQDQTWIKTHPAITSASRYVILLSSQPHAQLRKGGRLFGRPALTTRRSQQRRMYVFCYPTPPGRRPTSIETTIQGKNHITTVLLHKTSRVKIRLRRFAPSQT